MNRQKYNVTPRVVAITLMLIISLTALAAGYSFIVDPNGRGIGIDMSYLDHSPFSDFLIPGITLFIYNGVLNLIAAIHGIMKGRQFPAMSLVQGWVLIVWIVVQIAMVRDFNALHFFCLLAGSALVVAGRRMLSDSNYQSHREA